MNDRWVRTAAAVAVGVSLGAGVALAGAHAPKASDHAKMMTDALTQAKVTAKQALEKAMVEKTVAGAQALAVELETEHGKAYWGVAFSVGEGVKSVHIDTQTGAVLAVEDEKTSSHEKADMDAAAHAMTGGKLTLGAIIDAATAKAGKGRVANVQPKTRASKPVYEARFLAEGGQWMVVDIDPGTGAASAPKPFEQRREHADKSEKGPKPTSPGSKGN